jgi:hypothetical protein
MKFFVALLSIGILAGGHAMAADYSVGIVNLGAGEFGGGTALNLYSIKKTGIELIQTYVLDRTDFTGKLSTPLTLAVNPAQDFVYVAYTGLSQPNIVGFKITPTGLVLKWEEELETGDASLQGSTLSAGADYVIENTYPAGLWIHVLNQAGKELIDDYQDSTVTSGHVDSTRTFYYSCRAASSAPPATSVSVYRFDPGVDVHTNAATPVGTSSNPAFIQSVCN